MGDNNNIFLLEEEDETKNQNSKGDSSLNKQKTMKVEEQIKLKLFNVIG